MYAIQITGAEILYNIIFALFIWLFFSICFFLYRYFRHIRQERSRFLALEPDFQQFNQRYNSDLEGNNSGILGRIMHLFSRLNAESSLTLNLPDSVKDYKSCIHCGTITVKEELKCEICGCEEFILLEKKKN